MNPELASKLDKNPSSMIWNSVSMAHLYHVLSFSWWNNHRYWVLCTKQGMLTPPNTWCHHWITSHDVPLTNILEGSHVESDNLFYLRLRCLSDMSIISYNFSKNNLTKVFQGGHVFRPSFSLTSNIFSLTSWYDSHFGRSWDHQDEPEKWYNFSMVVQPVKVPWLSFFLKFPDT